MASSIVSSVAVASVNRTSPAQATVVAPFTGLKSASTIPMTRKLNNDITSIASNGGRVQCMQVVLRLKEKFIIYVFIWAVLTSDLLKYVSIICIWVQVWPPVGLKKFETLSYLPARTPEQLAKEIDYLIRNKWVPCLEFELEVNQHFI